LFTRLSARYTLGIGPGDAVFAGDSYRPDYLGPVQAGMPSFLIDPGAAQERGRTAVPGRGRELVPLGPRREDAPHRPVGRVAGRDRLGAGHRVEQVERLKRSQVLCRRDDEARDRRAEAEVGRDAPERERGSTLLWRYQGDEQRLVRGADRADPGTADDRASERLSRPVDERKPGIAERARKIAGDQDRLGAKVIERGSRGRCHEGGRAQDRGKHQTGGGRREAADLVQVDDLEREDQPIAEEADRIPCLQEQDQSGQVRPPTSR
jgi:hypothetical protein